MKMIVTIATCGSALLFTSLVLAAARGHRQMVGTLPPSPPIPIRAPHQALMLRFVILRIRRASFRLLSHRRKIAELPADQSCRSHARSEPVDGVTSEREPTSAVSMH